jgi:hypothetical protein
VAIGATLLLALVLCDLRAPHFSSTGHALSSLAVNAECCRPLFEEPFRGSPGKTGKPDPC